MKSFFLSILDRLKTAEHTFMVGVAVLIGCLAGIGAVLFRNLIGLIQRLFWGEGAFGMELVRSHPRWWIIAAPAIGVPLMVALLALTAPKNETPVDAAGIGPSVEQVDCEVVYHAASGLLADCPEQPAAADVTQLSSVQRSCGAHQAAGCRYLVAAMKSTTTWASSSPLSSCRK